MERTQINILKLVNQTNIWKRKELNKIIYKYFKKTIRVANYTKFLIKLEKWKDYKKYSLGRQINVCKGSGKYKRTFNFVGFNRHMIRQNMNTNKIPHLKKLSW